MKCAGELKVKKCDNQDQLELDFSAGDLQSILFDNTTVIQGQLLLRQDQLNLDSKR